MAYPDGENVSTEYLLYNENDDEWFTVQTDANGNFNTYVPSGEWLVIISPTDYDNKSYTLRQPVVISSESSLRTEISLTLVEVVQIEFMLEEQNSGLPVEKMLG